MPLVRIDVSKDASEDRVRTISRVVYEAMTQVARVPENDKFQIITRHAADELIYPPDGYLGITYTRDIVFIQVTWVAGRSIEVKKQFYKKIADDITTETDMRREDVFISLIGTGMDDWSFGNGIMQYAPKEALASSCREERPPTFQGKQMALRVEAAGEAGERSVGADHAMAGHDDRDGVAPDRGTDGA